MKTYTSATTIFALLLPHLAEVSEQGGAEPEEQLDTLAVLSIAAPGDDNPERAGEVNPEAHENAHEAQGEAANGDQEKVAQHESEHD